MKENYDLKAIGARLKEIRDKRKFTASQIAAELIKEHEAAEQLSEAAIYRYEQGQCMPPPQRLLRYCELGNCSLDFLIFGLGRNPYCRLLSLFNIFDKDEKVYLLGHLAIMVKCFGVSQNEKTTKGFPEQNTTQKVGFRLKALRKQSGKTQRQLAKKINIPYNTLISYENARLLPNLHNFLSYSNFFGCSLDHLISDEDRNLPKTMQNLLKGLSWQEQKKILESFEETLHLYISFKNKKI